MLCICLKNNMAQMDLTKRSPSYPYMILTMPPPPAWILTVPPPWIRRALRLLCVDVPVQLVLMLLALTMCAGVQLAFGTVA